MGIIELVTIEATQTAKLEGKLEGRLEGKLEGKGEGLYEGERRKMLLTIQKLIANTDFGNEQITLITDGTLELVQTIRERLAAGNREIEDLI